MIAPQLESQGDWVECAIRAKTALESRRVIESFIAMTTPVHRSAGGEYSEHNPDCCFNDDCDHGQWFRVTGKVSTYRKINWFDLWRTETFSISFQKGHMTPLSSTATFLETDQQSATSSAIIYKLTPQWASTSTLHLPHSIRTHTESILHSFVILHTPSLLLRLRRSNKQEHFYDALNRLSFSFLSYTHPLLRAECYWWFEIKSYVLVEFAVSPSSIHSSSASLGAIEKRFELLRSCQRQRGGDIHRLLLCDELLLVPHFENKSRGRKETSHVYTCFTFWFIRFYVRLAFMALWIKNFSLPHRFGCRFSFRQSSNELENFYVFSSGWERIKRVLYFGG